MGILLFHFHMRATPEQLPIGHTYALAADKTDGLYKVASPQREELRRALIFATEHWGADTPWESIQESDWVLLLQKRLELLLEKKTRAVRATEITVSRLITVVRWLRKTKRITRDAAQWPGNWKGEIARHWKAVTGSLRDPTPFQPKHTLDDVARIREASDFDARFQLLMWFTAERLGQVIRARRADLDLRDGSGDGYGTLTIRGHGTQGTSVLQLNAGQRAALDRALAGYLAEKERIYRADPREDYVLFPSGYFSGKGRDKPGKAVDYTKPLTASWARKSFLIAEKRAGVPHIKGRLALGLRRVVQGEGSRSFAERHFHAAIVEHAKRLFLQGNYFHCVFEAAKAYNAEVKRRSRSSKDGSALMLEVLSADKGGLRITAGITETDRNVQEGVKFLSAGLMQAIRNPTAHESALDWPIARDDALDILSFISFLFRQLDRATAV